jgi:hypothetical protein
MKTGERQMKLKLWHGGKRWVGPPEIKPPKKGRCEYGPGIYFTNSLMTAQKYSKGGKVITLTEIEVEPENWLNNKRLPFEEVINFVSSTSWRGKQPLISRLKEHQLKFADRLPGEFFLEVLVNAFVNLEMSGKPGVELAQFLVSKGVYAHHSRTVASDTVVVFNPKIIVDWKVIPSSEINYDEPTELPRVEILKGLSNATH